MTHALIIKPITGSALKSNSLELKKAANNTIAIFIVLLATRIVLRSFSGLLYNLSAIFDCLFLVDLNFSMSSGLKEKKATSAADINAEPNRRIIRISSPINILRSGGLKVIPESGNNNGSVYSGFNRVYFSNIS